MKNDLKYAKKRVKIYLKKKIKKGRNNSSKNIFLYF